MVNVIITLVGDLASSGNVESIPQTFLDSLKADVAKKIDNLREDVKKDISEKTNSLRLGIRDDIDKKINPLSSDMNTLKQDLTELKDRLKNLTESGDLKREGRTLGHLVVC